MIRFTAGILAFVYILALALPLRAATQEWQPFALYFLTAVPDGERCILRSLFFPDPGYYAFRSFQPRILNLEIKATLIFKTHESISLRQRFSPWYRGEQQSNITPFDAPCDEFRYLEVSEALCTISFLGPHGEIKYRGPNDYSNCLGKAPRRIGLIGTFDPDDPTMLLPLEFPPSPE